MSQGRGLVGRLVSSEYLVCAKLPRICPSSGYNTPMSEDAKNGTPKRRRTKAGLDGYWLEQAVDATMLANSMPTTELKSEVAHIAAQFLRLAQRDAPPTRRRKSRRANRRFVPQPDAPRGNSRDREPEHTDSLNKPPLK
jgi:hypothetical protein